MKRLWQKYKNRISSSHTPNVDIGWELLNRSWVCRQCEETHSGIFDLASFCPCYWNDEEIYEPNSLLRAEGDFLSEDFCVLSGEHFFIRSVLELPLIGREGRFAYGVWVSSSKSNFEFYIERFDSGDFDETDGWFGWLSNNLKGYPDCTKLGCGVIPQRNRQRPKLILHETEHPLVREQNEGISIDRLLEIYSLNGHQILAS